MKRLVSKWKIWICWTFGEINTEMKRDTHGLEGSLRYHVHASATFLYQHVWQIGQLAAISPHVLSAIIV